MWIQNEKGGIKFDRGDCVVIEGALEGSSTLESAFGAEFDVPYMWIGKQTKVEIDCLQAMYPAIATAEPNTKSRTYSSVKILLEKIELAADHTRVFFTIENNYSNAEITFYEMNTLIVQDRKQYGTAYVFEDFDNIPENQGFQNSLNDLRKKFLKF